MFQVSIAQIEKLLQQNPFSVTASLTKILKYITTLLPKTPIHQTSPNSSCSQHTHSSPYQSSTSSRTKAFPIGPRHLPRNLHRPKSMTHIPVDPRIPTHWLVPISPQTPPIYPPRRTGFLDFPFITPPTSPNRQSSPLWSSELPFSFPLGALIGCAELKWSQGARRCRQVTRLKEKVYYECESPFTLISYMYQRCGRGSGSGEKIHTPGKYLAAGWASRDIDRLVIKRFPRDLFDFGGAVYFFPPRFCCTKDVWRESATHGAFGPMIKGD